MRRRGVGVFRRTAPGVALVVLWLAALELTCGEAAAQPRDPPPTYEAQRVEKTLRENSFEREAAAEGKRVAWIRVFREDVFLENDLYIPILIPRVAPTWPNALHWLTKEDIVVRELLFGVGDAYAQVTAEESERNLRSLGILAHARIVPVRTDNPDEVGVVVYTRDLWSLRLETNFNGAGKAAEVSAQLIERNLFGRQKQAAIRFDLDPKSFSFGQSYFDRRVAMGELQLFQSFDVIFNSESGKPEGSRGRLRLARPFYNLAQHWSYEADASYAVFVKRSLTDGDYVGYDPVQDEQCDPDLPDCARVVWGERRVLGTLAAHYRVGERYRATFSAGLAVDYRGSDPNQETQLDPEYEEAYRERLMPTERRDIYPFVRYRLFLPDYKEFENLGSFGQTETVRQGPAADATLRLPIEAFGSSQNAFEPSAAISYVFAEHDALVVASAFATTRLQDGRVIDQYLRLEVKGATPTWLWGRIVPRLLWEGRDNDSSRTQVTLGANNGLRGYVSDAFRVIGGDRLLGNLEYRTLPLELASIHFGFVAFYDVGTVYGQGAPFQLHHSLGAGMRFLFPQFNRTVFRLDVGVPLDADGFTVVFSYGGNQVVPLTALEESAASRDGRL